MWSECMRRIDCNFKSVDVKDERKEMGMSSQYSLENATRKGRLGDAIHSFRLRTIVDHTRSYRPLHFTCDNGNGYP